MLADFNGPIGCPGCVDQPIGWAEVDFSDGTKKSVSYNLGSTPASVSALIRKIGNAGMKSVPEAPEPKSQSPQ